MFALPSRFVVVCLSTALCILSLTFAAVAGDNNWQPVSPAELALKQPKIEKDADAEALLWEVFVANEDTGSAYQTVLQHYLRVKIFTERGREQFTKIDIPYYRISGSGRRLNIRVKDIAARTIKADGSIVELDGKEIFERELVKGDGLKVKAKSFAVPGIEPGAIIEYRWKEVRGIVSYNQTLDFAREIPVHRIKYYIKPIPHPSLGMRGIVFNGNTPPFSKEKNGFTGIAMDNVPSFKEEPRMPSEYSVRPWMLLYYTEDTGKTDAAKFWKEHGKTVYEDNKTGIKVGDDVRQTVAQAVGDAATPEQKVERIFHYIRANIKNVNDDIHNFSVEDRKKVAENKTPAGTLKLGFGDYTDINRLFVAMINAAGLEARITNLPRRSEGNFNINFANDYFIRTSNVAVKINDKWKFYDPGVRYLPFGMLSWEEEGQPTLISDPKEPIWTQAEFSAPQKSLEKRTGKFKLLEDGTLEGTVTIEFTGHLAAFHKEYNDDDDPQEREETLKNKVKYEILGSAELSDIAIENVTEPEKPFIYKFKVRVPGYATRTGKRIFFQPNVFERSAKPMFETATRRYDIEFRYPYSEQDNITIELPAGYALESPDSPAALKDGQGISLDQIKMSVTTDGKNLNYKRDFYFGNNGFLRFPVDSYAALKQLFEAFHKANTHSLTLKQGAATSAAQAPAANGAPTKTN